ncbi:ABC transporter permease [Antribacter gilvus]|uniref:ABC transporter permease n=1 Tax=Antribacter gilvus TaxID=2304675 RepID=UPI000F7B3ED6|nr:ABC transporter permease [Antribacter gilvus]
MTAQTVPTARPDVVRPAAPRPDATVSGIPFLRLALVEWRKQLDTRAGRWLLIVIGLLTAGILAIMAFVGDGNRTFAELLIGTVSPMAILLPVVGILAATAEWSQRTALVTFTLEPRRTRVGLAKLLSALASGVAFFGLSMALAALAQLGLMAFRGADGDWSLDGEILGGAVLLLLLSMAQGVAFGTLLLNTPAAIVAYFALPTVLSIVGAFVASMRDVLPWIDFTTASGPLLAGGMGGEDWARLATATAIWVVAPLVGGLVRVVRSEVRSA